MTDANSNLKKPGIVGSSQNSISLDSIEPVMITGSSGDFINNPSPQNFSSAKTVDPQMSSDPSKPRGEPQLVGLTQIKYNSLDLTQVHGTLNREDLKENYSEKTIEYFYAAPSNRQAKTLLQDDKSSTKALLQKASEQPKQFKTIQILIDLPQETVVEQIQLHSKQGQDFSKKFKVLRVENCQSTGPMALKSAFGESVTNKHYVELNTVGVASRLKITLLSLLQETKKRSPTVEIDPSDDISELDNEVALISKLHHDRVNHEEIELQVSSDAESIKRLAIEEEDREMRQAMKQGVLMDEDDDLAILDSLPQSFQKQAGYAPNKVQENLELKPAITSSSNGGLTQRGFTTGNESILPDYLDSISVLGFNCNAIPAITNLTYLMNQSFHLRKENRLDEADRVDLIVAVLLITTKRATQATEVLRKMQARYITRVTKIQENLQQMDLRGQDTTPFKQEAQDILVKCAIFELMSADSLSAETNMAEKIDALMRMSQFSMGQMPSAIRFETKSLQQEDPFSQMLKILPNMLRFTILCLTHKMEIVQMSALKIIKFVLETQGCSLDFAMVFILKGMLHTFPVETKIEHQVLDFDFSVFEGEESVSTINSFLFKHGPLATPLQKLEKVPITRYAELNQPQSGFKVALQSIYTHVLDTFISVLSSISSHILHSIFYEVIVPVLSNKIKITQKIPEVKMFACKIAEKIITICQGDLLLGHQLLDSMVDFYCNAKATAETSSQGQNQAMKTLWQSIRQKVFPNYSTRGFRSLIQWLLHKFEQLASEKERTPEMIKQQELSPGELSDEENLLLIQLCDVITIVAVGRQKNEEEANQLIKLPAADSYGGASSAELYLVLPSLLFWLEYSVNREDRLQLFQQLYQTLKDVLESMPPGKVDLDIISIMMPSLERTCDFLEGNSPSLQMLKFLDIVLTDVISIFNQKVDGQVVCILPPELAHFFLEMLSNFVAYMSYSLYEEVFSVFDKLVHLSSDVQNQAVLKKCIVALVDKYTLKSKAHKMSLNNFMKSLLDVRGKSAPHEDPMSKADYFTEMTEFCFFQNKVSNKNTMPQLDFRSPTDLHDMFVDKLQFFIDSLTLLTDMHINLFTNLITHPNFKSQLMKLLTHGETNIRLKSHEILETLTAYFIQYCPSKTVYEFAGADGKSGPEQMDAEFISHERLYISQIVINVARKSLEQDQDCYLQFNALILLDFLFQNLLPVPTFHNEQIKTRKQNKNSVGSAEEMEALDIENLNISEMTPELDVMNPLYLKMRMRLVMSLWPHIQQALNSPWSNIRSICYGLICSMLKVDIADYPNEVPTGLSSGGLSQDDPLSSNLSETGPVLSEIFSANSATHTRLKEIILPMLYSLLSSKESESKAGGLNILGSFCGLSYDFQGIKIHKHIDFFQRNSGFVSLPIWKLVYQLQDDWDITIKEASVVLIQLCAPRNAINYFQAMKLKREEVKLEHMMTRMPPTSDIYRGDEENIKPPPGRTLAVSNPFAVKALSFFPKEADIECLLETQGDDNQEHSEGITSGNFADFLSGKNFMLNTEMMGREQIEAHHQMLAELVHDHDPDFKDERAVVKPLTRKEQLQLELKITSKNKKPEQPLPATNKFFFVDKYTDDQIQEIISIFRNDFKPPKNLWIEKQPTGLGIGQAATNGGGSSSPDFYQEIYAEAIEQFNQHQAHMQQVQQSQLQEQVSQGSSLSQVSNSTDSSKSSSPLMHDQLEDHLVNQAEQESKRRKSASASPTEAIDQEKQEMIQQAEEVRQAQKCNSKGLLDSEGFKYLDEEDSNTDSRVSSSNKNQVEEEVPVKQPSPRPLQLEKINFDGIEITPPLIRQQNRLQELALNRSSEYLYPDRDASVPISKKSSAVVVLDQSEENENKENQSVNQIKLKTTANLKLQENAYFSAEDAALAHLKNQTQKPAETRIRVAPLDNQKKSVSQAKVNCNSSPDIRKSGSGGSGGETISRKNIQAYFGGLNKGYISNIDKVKLINDCLKDDSQNDYQIPKPKKLNKSFENLSAANKLSIKTSQVSTSQETNNIKNGLTYNSTKSQKSKKNTTLSTSPKRPSGGTALSGPPLDSRRHSKGQGKHLKQKPSYSGGRQNSNSEGRGITQSGSSIKHMNNMADLNYFIKSIEKDLSEKFKNIKDFNSVPTTPTQVIKRIEDQMRAAYKYDGGKPTAASQTEMARMLESIDVQQSKKKTSSRPKGVKQLALHQLKTGALYEKNNTPQNTSGGNALLTGSNLNIVSQTNRGASTSRSPLRDHRHSEFNKTAKMDGLLSYQLLGQKRIKSQRGRDNRSSEGRLSSDRRHGSNSDTSRGIIGGPVQQVPLIIHTERNSRPLRPATHKVDKSAAVRFQPKHIKGKKAGSVLGPKHRHNEQGRHEVSQTQATLSPILRDEQSGSIMVPHSRSVNKSANQIGSGKERSNKQQLIQMLGNKVMKQQAQKSKGSTTNRYSGYDKSLLMEMVQQQKGHKSKHKHSKVSKKSTRDEFSPIATNQSGLVYFDTKQQAQGCVSARGPDPMNKLSYFSQLAAQPSSKQKVNKQSKNRSGQEKTKDVASHVQKPPMLQPTHFY